MQALENKLFLQLLGNRLGPSGSPVNTLLGLPCRFNSLAFREGETLCLFEDATATVLTTIAESGSLKDPSMASFSMAGPLLLRQVFLGYNPDVES